jgi:hypothetical protein
MVRGLDDGLLDDLWNFPSAFGSSRPEALASLRHKLAAGGSACVAIGDSIADLRHGITYRSIRVHAYPAEISRTPRKGPFQWFPIGRLQEAAISQLARKIAQQVF